MPLTITTQPGPDHGSPAGASEAPSAADVEVLMRDVCRGQHITPEALRDELADDIEDIRPGALTPEAVRLTARPPGPSDTAAQLAREAAEERVAILEHDGRLSRAGAEAVAALAEAFYSHLMGPGKDTGCCHAPVGRYCPEGERLRQAYYDRA